MRVHVWLDDDLVEDLDRLVGPRGRSPFIAEAVRKELDQRRRWEKFRSAFGSIADTGHPWDPDVARWVHASRRAEERPIPS